MTGAGTIETAVQAMQAGALDYVLKPIQLGAILPVLARASGVRRLRMKNLELRDTVAVHELNQAMAYTLDPNVLLDRIADAALAQSWRTASG
jgi:DNA-binding NtrC family response regulator